MSESGVGGDEVERTVWQGSPSQLVNLPAYLALLIGAIVATGLLLWLQSTRGAAPERIPNEPAASTASVVTWAIALIWLAAAAIAVARWIATASVKYLVTTERLRITTGILSTTTEEVELRRLRDSSIVKPFFLRVAGLGDIHLYSGDTSAARVTLHAIRDPDRVQSTIRSVAQALIRKFGVREIDIL